MSDPLSHPIGPQPTEIGKQGYVEDILELAGENTEAAYRTDVIQLFDDCDIAVLIDGLDVAGAQVFADEHLSVGNGSVPVVLHDLGPCDPQFAASETVRRHSIRHRDA